MGEHLEIIRTVDGLLATMVVIIVNFTISNMSSRVVDTPMVLVALQLDQIASNRRHPR